MKNDTTVTPGSTPSICVCKERTLSGNEGWEVLTLDECQLGGGVGLSGVVYVALICVCL